MSSQQNNLNRNMSEERERQRNRTIDKEAQRANLVKSGNQFITKFISVTADDQHLPKEQKDKYIQRVLHAIFFIGYVNDPSVSPMEFISNSNNNLWEKLKKKYPEPFEKYLTHLPCQTPYSILLEYMERNMPNNDTELMKKLVTFNTSLLQLGHENQEALVANDFSFAASVIACSKYDDKKTSISTYGASLSCKGKDLRKLMIAISTLRVWHEAISYVVCCGNRGDRIEFYNHFYCNAFNVAYNIDAQEYMYIPVSPCEMCHKMYKNVTFCPGFDNKTASWAYGNCGETESFSKLLLRLKDSKNDHLFTVINSKEKPLKGSDIEDTFNKEHKKPMTDYVNNILKQRKFNFDPKHWQLFSPV